MKTIKVIIGPLELLDVAGLDIYNSVAGYLNADLSAETGVSPLIKEKIEAGTLGLKTGRGLFAYTPEQIQALVQRRGKLTSIAEQCISIHPRSTGGTVFVAVTAHPA